MEILGYNMSIEKTRFYWGFCCWHS